MNQQELNPMENNFYQAPSSLSTKAILTTANLDQVETCLNLKEKENFSSFTQKNVQNNPISSSFNTKSLTDTDSNSVQKKLTILEALQKVGNSGKYQKLTYIFFCLQMTLTGMLLQSPTFLYEAPDFSCLNGLQGLECSEWVCQQNDPLQYAYNIPNSLIMHFDPPLICEREYIVNILLTFNYSFTIIGIFISIYIVDKKGRRFTSLIFWIIAGIASILSGIFTQSLWPIAICLSFAYLGVNPSHRLIYCFIQEHSDGPFREYSSAFISVFYGIGSLLLALSQYITDDWRYLMIFFFGIPTIVSSICYFYIYEPPITLFQTNVKKTVEILNKIAQINKKQQISESDLETIDNDSSFISNEKDNSKSDQKFNVFSLFKYKSTLITTVCCSLIQLVFNFSYLGIELNLQSIGFDDLKLNAIVTSCFEILGYLASVPIISRIKRRKNIYFMIAYNLIFISFFFFSVPEDFSQKIIQSFIIGLANSILSILISIHDAYISELYPVTIRYFGLGFILIQGEIGNILYGYLSNILENSKINPIGSIGVLGILASLLYIPLKETLNMPSQENIPEIIEKQRLQQDSPKFNDKNMQENDVIKIES